MKVIERYFPIVLFIPMLYKDALTFVEVEIPKCGNRSWTLCLSYIQPASPQPNYRQINPGMSIKINLCVVTILSKTLADFYRQLPLQRGKISFRTPSLAPTAKRLSWRFFIDVLKVYFLNWKSYSQRQRNVSSDESFIIVHLSAFQVHCSTSLLRGF